MAWQSAFPDYPVAEMPVIPSTWCDTSWRNDACPSFEIAAPIGTTLKVWIDYPDQSQREGLNLKRFILSAYENDISESVDLLMSDDWQAVLQLVEMITSNAIS